MIDLLMWIGRAAGVVGVLLGAAAVVARLMGSWYVGSMQVGTVLLASVAALALGALAYAAAVAERPRS